MLRKAASNGWRDKGAEEMESGRSSRQLIIPLSRLILCSGILSVGDEGGGAAVRARRLAGFASLRLDSSAAAPAASWALLPSCL